MKTWRCKDCGYVQDFEQTKENSLKHFGIDSEDCPSCFKKNTEWEIKE